MQGPVPEIGLDVAAAKVEEHGMCVMSSVFKMRCE
ncbi:hypothetical protein A2U01_0086317, partial [Trifolium medium]|nr:hypothetical protein [Trifolium medium]